jgi:hypothetical protein
MNRVQSHAYFKNSYPVYPKDFYSQTKEHDHDHLCVYVASVLLQGPAEARLSIERLLTPPSPPPEAMDLGKFCRSTLSRR